jgi:hypothetical protein
MSAPDSAAERDILAALDEAVRLARPAIDPIVRVVEQKLGEQPGEVLAWQPIPLEVYSVNLPETIRSSWVFVLRANVATGAERHPNSHQRMMAYRGRGDFPTQVEGKWRSHHMSDDPAAPLEQRWISIPPNVWHQGVVGQEDWAVVSFHTVLEDDLIEERPAADIGEPALQRRYSGES